MITINAHPEDVALAAARDAFAAAEAAVATASAAVDQARDRLAASGGSRGDIHGAKRVLAQAIEAQEDARSAVRVAERRAAAAVETRRAAATVTISAEARRLDAAAAGNTAAVRRVLARFLDDLGSLDRDAEELDRAVVSLANEANAAGVRVGARRPFILSADARSWGMAVVGTQRLLAGMPTPPREETPR